MEGSERDRKGVKRYLPYPSQNPTCKRVLFEEHEIVKYIAADEEISWLSYNILLLNNVVQAAEEEVYIDDKFCSLIVLLDLSKVYNEVRNVGVKNIRQLQKQLNNFSYPETVFHFSDAYLYANIDELTGWSISLPRCHNKHDLLFAVDICGGPGGFVEYLLTKKQWKAKVYGFDSVDSYKLTPTGHFPIESFEQWCGLNGQRGNGSIFNPTYVDIFSRFVYKSTNAHGVHLVVAGTRDQLSGKINDASKELHYKHLILAETYVGLKVLGVGGNFIIRVFDVFMSYTAGIVYLLSRAFKKVTIIRPETCIVGSTERFIVCLGFRGGKICNDIVSYLGTEHGREARHFSAEKEAKTETVHLISPDVFKKATKFSSYLQESNEAIGKLQITELRKLCNAVRQRTIPYDMNKRGMNIMTKASTVWNIPESLLQTPRYINFSNEIYLELIIKPYPEGILKRTAHESENILTQKSMFEEIACADDWDFVVTGKERGFYMSRGGNKVFQYTADHKWKMAISDLHLADQTLVYGDFVDEVIFQNNKQTSQVAFHIIDGLVLGGKDIRNLPYRKRLAECELFAKSMCKPSLENLKLIRVKSVENAGDLSRSLGRAFRHRIKGFGDKKEYLVTPVDIHAEKSPVCVHSGYLFMRTIRNCGVHLDFMSTMQNRLFWSRTREKGEKPVDRIALEEHLNMYKNGHRIPETSPVF